MSLALIRSGKLRCVYCGDPATNADHVPAIIYKHYDLPELSEDDLGYNVKTLIQAGKSTKNWILHRISFNPNDLDDLRFPYYQDDRQSQDRSLFLEAARGLPGAILKDFEGEIESLLKNDPWVNS